jgi:hypothetical protein
VWRLFREQEALGELVLMDADWPWLTARLNPAAGFEQVRGLFEEDLRLLETAEDDATAIAASDAVQARIRATVRLVDPAGIAVPEFLLHIDGQDAWWRWSDTPFPE